MIHLNGYGLENDRRVCMNLIEKIFGTHSEREIKMITPIVKKIEDMRDKMMSLSDDELKQNTVKFKERIAGGESLDSILPEAFAPCFLK